MSILLGNFIRTYSAYRPSGVKWLDDVPKHWKINKIKNLARPGKNTFVDGDWIESPYITSDGIRLIQTGNIGTGEYREKGFRYISDETFKDLACTEIQSGDILICRLGKPVARACLAPQLRKRMITSVDVCILKPHDVINARFIVYCMSSRPYLDWVGSLVRGSTRDRVSRSMLGAFPIPLPPLSEQRAIVRYLDYVDRRIFRYVTAKQEAHRPAGGREAGHHQPGRHPAASIPTSASSPPASSGWETYRSIGKLAPLGHRVSASPQRQVSHTRPRNDGHHCTTDHGIPFLRIQNMATSTGFEHEMLRGLHVPSTGNFLVPT